MNKRSPSAAEAFHARHTRRQQHAAAPASPSRAPDQLVDEALQRPLFLIALLPPRGHAGSRHARRQLGEVQRRWPHAQVQWVEGHQAPRIMRRLAHPRLPCYLTGGGGDVVICTSAAPSRRPDQGPSVRELEELLSLAQGAQD